MVQTVLDAACVLQAVVPDTRYCTTYDVGKGPAGTPHDSVTELLVAAVTDTPATWPGTADVLPLLTAESAAYARVPPE